MTKLTASQERELREAFDLFDSGRYSLTIRIQDKLLFSDRSGRISRTELKQVLNALNVKTTEKEQQQLMNMMDTDHSGDIDYNEFKRVMADSYFKKHSRQELSTAFKRFDSDGNGYITTKELNEILSRMGRHLNRHEVEAMIKTLDTNGDGKVSFDEFCKLFD